MERLRYATYDYEKRLSGRVLRTRRAAMVEGLYVVVDRQAAGPTLAHGVGGTGHRRWSESDSVARQGGRAEQVYREAVEVNAICVEKGALFIMNDYCDIAVAIGAAGLHVGQRDLPLQVRRCCRSTPSSGYRENVAESVRALEEGADYVAVGAVFPTSQKAGAVPVGLRREGRDAGGCYPSRGDWRN